jgi:hypothetical protein
MTTVEATSEVFWTAFRALPKKEREAVIEKLLRDKEFIEDLIDIVIIEQRRKEPSRSLDEYLADMDANCYPRNLDRKNWIPGQALNDEKKKGVSDCVPGVVMFVYDFPTTNP